MTEPTFRIVLVEDCPADVQLLQAVIARQPWPSEVTVACDGLRPVRRLFRPQTDGAGRVTPRGRNHPPVLGSRGATAHPGVVGRRRRGEGLLGSL